MGWTPAAVESELIAAFRAMPSCPVFSTGRRSPGGAVHTADMSYRGQRKALTDVLNWGGYIDRDARKYLWAWARCKATKDSFAAYCREMGWPKSEAERGRRRGAERLAATLNRATQTSAASTKKSLDFEKGGIGRFPDIAAPPGVLRAPSPKEARFDMATSGDIEPINTFGRHGRERVDNARRVKPPRGRYDGLSHDTRMPAAGLARTPLKDETKLADQLARVTSLAAELRARGPGASKLPGAWTRSCQQLEAQAAVLQRRIDALTRDASVSVGAVVDPWGTGTQRLYVSIERRVDILEMELSHGRISEAAYQTGRQVQALLERQGKVKSVDWGGASRGDPALAIKTRIILFVLNAHEILDLQERIRGRIGILDMRLLRRIVGDRLSFSDCAALEGKGGKREYQTYIAKRFRDALEQLADVFAARGKGQSLPDDAYKIMASTDVGTRETRSVVAGVTRERLTAELAALRVMRAETKSFRHGARLAAEIDALERRLAAFAPG